MSQQPVSSPYLGTLHLATDHKAKHLRQNALANTKHLCSNVCAKIDFKIQSCLKCRGLQAATPNRHS